VRGELEKELGAESAEIIMAVTKLKPDGVEIYTPEHAQYVYQRNIASEVRCVLVKLGDRTHNLQTIDALPVAKQIDTIVESIEYWRILEPYAHHPEYGKAVLSLLNKQWEIIKPRTPRHNIPVDEPRWAYAPVSVV
jgi:(p)ppGpp synthase/HD superfamily hydrolase